MKDNTKIPLRELSEFEVSFVSGGAHSAAWKVVACDLPPLSWMPSRAADHHIGTEPSEDRDVFPVRRTDFTSIEVKTSPNPTSFSGREEGGEQFSPRPRDWWAFAPLFESRR